MAVVRYEDLHLAEIAQQVFEFDAVLNPATALAATPAFAAAVLTLCHSTLKQHKQFIRDCVGC